MVRVPSKFNGTFVTRHFFPEYFKEYGRMAINSGRCYDWAYIAWRLFPGTTIWNHDDHAWAEWQGRFYDSETTRGVGQWENLAFHRRHPSLRWSDVVAPVEDVEEFKRFWDRNGAGYHHHWDNMLEQQINALAGPLYTEDEPVFKSVWERQGSRHGLNRKQ